MNKKIYFLCTERDAELRTFHVDNAIWNAAHRVLARCRRGLIKQVMVSGRTEDAGFQPFIVGRVF